MDNINPARPQPAPSLEATPYEFGQPADFDDSAAPPEADAPAPSYNAGANLVHNIETYVGDFVRARPVTSMGIALATGIGLALVSISLASPTRRSPYGKGS